ncbi:hypothetical protein FB451DRAFT_1472581 [Mycena latifolia]|nr:hypothetical protein FB451DRAFT_1472581 [Mycena latifolia]
MYDSHWFSVLLYGSFLVPRVYSRPRSPSSPPRLATYPLNLTRHPRRDPASSAAGACHLCCLIAPAARAPPMCFTQLRSLSLSGRRAAVDQGRIYDPQLAGYDSEGVCTSRAFLRILPARQHEIPLINLAGRLHMYPRLWLPVVHALDAKIPTLPVHT